jgi:hypothetical protein
MTDQLGDGSIETKYKKRMEAVASAVDQVFNGDTKGKNRKIGFVLLVFEFNESEKRINYISNGADRRDIITLFKEQIKRFEGQPDVQGKA